MTNNFSTVGNAFGVPAAPTLVTRSLDRSEMTVTELRCDSPNFGVTQPIPYDDAYLVSLQLRACPGHDLFFGGRMVRPENFTAGVTSIYDLRLTPFTDIRDPFHSLHFYLPRRVLDDVAYDLAAPAISDLQYKNATGIDDPVARHLLLSLMPSISRPHEASTVFVDHVALALSTHMAETYGKIRARRRHAKGGLPPPLERRVKEILIANMHGNVPLRRLADECGLSERHFVRVFKQATGFPPFRWLGRMRVKRAKQLLRHRSIPLAEIALQCGFADQSHFTRAFAQVTGTTPGAWQRMHL